MRKILYFAGMALMATLALASCKDDNGKDDGGNGGGGAQRLAVPQLVLSDTTETSVTVSWGAIENAATYTYVFNNGEEASTAETSFIMETPEAGEYTFRVKAVPAEGSEEYTDSQWSSTISYVFKGSVVAPTEGLSKWFGTYTLTSTATAIMGVSDDGSSLEPGYEPTPLTREITIMPYEYDDSVALVLGLTELVLQDQDGNQMSGFHYARLLPSGELSIRADYDPMGKGADGMYCIAALTFQDGSTAYAYAAAIIDMMNLSFVGEMDYSFVLIEENGEIVGLPVSGTLSGGDPFTVQATDIFAFDDSGAASILVAPTELPGGEWSLVKTSDEYSVNAFSRNVMNVGPAVFGYYEMIEVGTVADVNFRR